MRKIIIIFYLNSYTFKVSLLTIKEAIFKAKGTINNTTLEERTSTTIFEFKRIHKNDINGNTHHSVYAPRLVLQVHNPHHTNQGF